MKYSKRRTRIVILFDFGESFFQLCANLFPFFNSTIF